MLIVLRALVAAEVYVSVVGEFGVKCESKYFGVCGHG